MFKNMLRFLWVLSGMMLILSGGFVSAFAADKPEIFVQLGHQNAVNTVGFSPDGVYTVTGSDDFTVKLWDTVSGAEVRTFSGHGANITAVAVSADGRLVVSGDDKGILKLWDATTGREIRTMTISSRHPSVRFICFSPDARTFSTVAMGILTVWDVSSGRPLQTVANIQGSSWLAPGEPLLVAAPEYRQYVLVESSTGKALSAFKYDKDLTFHGISFSRDGRYGLFMGDDTVAKRTRFELLEVAENKIVASWDADAAEGFRRVALSPDGRQAIAVGGNGLKLYDAMSGKEVKPLHKAWVAAFSPDGRFFLTSGHYAPALYDAASGSVLRYLLQRPLSEVYSAAFSPDGRQAIVASHNAPPLLWDVANGKAVKIFNDYSSVFNFSADGRNLLLANKNKTIDRWDIAAGKPVKTFPVQGTSVAFSLDGRLVAEKVADGQINVWEYPTGKEVLKHAEPSGPIRNFRVSENGRYLLTIMEKTARRIDLETGAQETFPWAESFYSMSLSSDGRYIVAIVQNVDANNKIKDALKIYDIEVKREVRSYPDAVWITSFVFSPDGRRVLFAIKNDLVLCDVSSGDIVKTFSGHASTVYDLDFSPGGERILSAGSDQTIKLWDTASGRALMTFIGHDNWVRSAGISEDGKHVLSAGNDHTIRLWDVATGKERAKFLSFTDGEWIVITPEGYYNASANGEKYLNVRIRNNIYSIDNFREAFYRPDLVAVALSGGSLKDFRKLADVKPPPTVGIVDTPQSVATDNLTVKLRLMDNGGGIGDIRMYLNGTAVVMDSRAVKVIPNASAALMKEYTLKLAAGGNIIKAVAFNGDNTMQSNAATLAVTAAFAAAEKPSLSALVIGINEFTNPKLKLNFTVADAELFAESLKQVSAGLFDKVNIRKLTARETTTNAAIIREIQSFRSLRPDDLFVFYIASHGTVDDGEYFLITSNVGSLRTEKLRTDALSQNMLKEAIANIPATKKLIIIDTCNAGALGDALQMAMLTRGMSENTALKILSRAMGSTILSASTSVQEALEGYQGHGLFTYVLAEGLKGKADKGKTGFIKTTDLADYVDNEVPLLAEKVFRRAQYPTISISGQAFPIGKVQ